VNLLDHDLAAAVALVGLEAQHGDPLVAPRRSDGCQCPVRLRPVRQFGVVGACVVPGRTSAGGPKAVGLRLPSSRRCS
jgi:hypothetical protein